MTKPKTSPKAKAKTSPKATKKSPKAAKTSPKAAKTSPSRVPKTYVGNTFVDQQSFIPAFKRLALKAGVLRMSGNSYKALAAYADDIVNHIVSALIFNIEADKRKTIRVDDVHNVLLQMGEKVLPSFDYLENYPHCDISEQTTAQEQAADYQAQTHSHHFSKAPFGRMLREHTQKISNDVRWFNDVRWSEEAIMYVMFYVENKLEALLEASKAATEHTKRTTLKADDIEVVVKTVKSLCPSRAITSPTERRSSMRDYGSDWGSDELEEIYRQLPSKKPRKNAAAPKAKQGH